jgi:2',3'-cyclic-nucleotide 2'-phosphodiesterase (5'-nucleotidase family)
VEAGDAFGPYMPIERKKARLMVQAMAEMGYDAYNLGARELSYGQKFIKDQTAQWKIPLVCANLTHAADGKPFTTPYVVKDLMGFKVGILGLMSGLYNAHKYRPEDKDLLVADPLQVAKEIVPRLRKETDAVVVIGHFTMEEATQLAEEVAGIQVIILAWAMGIIDPPVQIKDTYILSAGTKGSHLGEFYLHLNQKGQVISHHAQLIPLGRAIPEDPKMRKLINSYGLTPPVEEPHPAPGEALPKI